MKPTISRTLRHLGIGGLLLVGPTACNEDQTAEVNRLNQELESVQADLASQFRLAEEHEEELKEANSKVMELKTELTKAERKLRDAERDLARYQKREEAERQAEEKQPSATEQRAAAKEAVAEHLDAMVTIDGDLADGIGVLVEDGGKTWIYANRDTIARNSKLKITTQDSSELSRFGTFEAAEDSPVVRLEVLDEDLKGLPIGKAEVDPDRRAVPMMSFDAGGSVIEGRGYGNPGDADWRVDARIMSCPVGSPVFHGTSGALIGLVSEAPSGESGLWSSDREDPRHAANQVELLAGASGWAEVPIGTFLEETRMIDSMDRTSRLLHAFAATSTGPSGLGYGTIESGVSASEVLDDNKNMPEVKALRELDPWLRENSERTSSSDINKRIGGAYIGMQRLATRQAKAFAKHRFSPPNAAAAKRSMDWNKTAGAAFGKRLEEIR